MNREIKFRGKRIKNAEWITGSLFTRNTEAWIFTGDDIDCFDGECSMWVDIDSEVILKTVGQYTGLKDDDGKDIYEGDIVSILSWKGVVVYNNEYASFNVRCGRSNIDIKNFFAYGGKVIGNIHDNHELLQ